METPPCWLGGTFTVDLADLIPLTVAGRPIGRGWFGENRTKTLTPQMAASHSERVGVYGHRTGWLNTGAFLVVVDCDVKNGVDGIASYAQSGYSTDTLYLPTKSGGRHYYFLLMPDQVVGNALRNRVGILPGVDIRGQGGFVRIYENDLNILVVDNGERH